MINAFLTQATFPSNEGPPGDQGPIPTIPPSVQDTAFCVFALALLFLALILVFRTATIHSWFIREKEAPGVWLPTWLSCGASLFVLFWWYYMCRCWAAVAFSNEYWWIEIFEYLVLHPREWAPGLLIASIPPATIAVYNAITTLAIVRSTDLTQQSSQQSPLAIVASAVISFINLLASLVTLSVYFFDL
jgi:hypothetical protein